MDTACTLKDLHGEPWILMPLFAQTEARSPRGKTG